MFTLTQGFIEQVFQKRDYFVIILGLDNVGKTTFLEQVKSKFVQGYKMLNPARITSTVGLNTAQVEIGPARLNFWDVGGQADLRSLWDKYYDEAHAVIFVVDASQPDSLAESRSVFNNVMLDERIQRLPMLVVCNKSEQDDAATVSDVREILDSPAVPPTTPKYVIESGKERTEGGGSSTSKPSPSAANSVFELHASDLAMLPVSALQGLNIERSVRWLLTALRSAEERE